MSRRALRSTPGRRSAAASASSSSGSKTRRKTPAKNEASGSDDDDEESLHYLHNTHSDFLDGGIRPLKTHSHETRHHTAMDELATATTVAAAAAHWRKYKSPPRGQGEAQGGGGDDDGDDGGGGDNDINSNDDDDDAAAEAETPSRRTRRNSSKGRGSAKGKAKTKSPKPKAKAKAKAKAKSPAAVVKTAASERPSRRRTPKPAEPEPEPEEEDVGGGDESGADDENDMPEVDMDTYDGVPANQAAANGDAAAAAEDGSGDAAAVAAADLPPMPVLITLVWYTLCAVLGVFAPNAVVAWGLLSVESITRLAGAGMWALSVLSLRLSAAQPSVDDIKEAEVEESEEHQAALAGAGALSVKQTVARSALCLVFGAVLFLKFPTVLQGGVWAAFPSWWELLWCASFLTFCFLVWGAVQPTAESLQNAKPKANYILVRDSIRAYRLAAAALFLVGFLALCVPSVWAELFLQDGVIDTSKAPHVVRLTAAVSAAFAAAVAGLWQAGVFSATGAAEGEIVDSTVVLDAVRVHMGLSALLLVAIVLAGEASVLVLGGAAGAVFLASQL